MVALRAMKTSAFLPLAATLVLAPLFPATVRSQEPSDKGREKNPPRGEAEPGRETATAGDLREGFGYAGFVFYFLPEPAADPAGTFVDLAKAAFPKTEPEELGREDRWDPERPMVGFLTESAPLEDFPTPDKAQLRFLARGVSEDDAAAMAETDRAFVLRVAYPKDAIWENLRAANGLAASFAEATNALIWDSTTRELFSPDSFRARRIETWPAGEGAPDIRHQITIHAYKKEDGDFCRAVTLGMRKFALPDVAFEDFTWSDNRLAGNLINLACQHLAESAGFDSPADAELAVSKIQNTALRASLEAQIIGKGTGSAHVEILLGKWEEGDAANRLIEIGCRHYLGKNLQLRQARLFEDLFGSEDAIVNVSHDEEILAASERARAMLPALRRFVERGLPPGGHLLLKAPFARDDGGNEWMWVEVLGWKDENTVRGILRNDPFHIKGLHAGGEVEFAEDDVFDYLLRKPDGSTEGNETGKLIQRKAEAEEKASPGN